jgi:hypothetical protein
MATEVLYATSHITGGFSNPDNAVGNTPSTWAGDINVNVSATSRWAIGDSVDPLTPAFTTHTIAVVMRKGGNSGNPTAVVRLFEDGTLVKTLASATITSTTGQTLSGTFTTAEIGDRNNIEVEVAVTGAAGGGSVRNSAQVSHFVATLDTTEAAEPVDIAPNNSAHSQTVTEPTVTVTAVAVPANSVHGHTATQPSVTPTAVVAVENSLHVQVAGQPTVTVTAQVTVASSLHAQTVTEPTVGTIAPVLPFDALHGHTATSPTITATTVVVPEFGLHGQSASEPEVEAVLLEAVVFDPANGAHSQTVSEPFVLSVVRATPLYSWDGSQWLKGFLKVRKETGWEYADLYRWAEVVLVDTDGTVLVDTDGAALFAGQWLQDTEIISPMFLVDVDGNVLVDTDGLVVTVPL